jgi:hypothetical protein
MFTPSRPQAIPLRHPFVNGDNLRGRNPVIQKLCGLLLAALSASQAESQQVPLGESGGMVVQSSPKTLLLDSGYLHPQELSVAFGEGLAFDLDNNLFVPAGGGLRVYGPDYQLLGAVTVTDPQIGADLRPYDIALRNAQQAFSCNADFNTPARLLAWDIANLADPRFIQVVYVDGLACRGIAFDGSGNLWVASYHQLTRLTLDTSGNVVASQAYPMDINPLLLAFQPGMARLAITSFGFNVVAIRSASDPAVSDVTLTNVCDEATWNAVDVTFNARGDLFVSCSNFEDSSNTDVVGVSSEILATLSGSVDLDAVANVKIALSTHGLGNTAGFIAFRHATKAELKNKKKE